MQKEREKERERDTSEIKRVVKVTGEVYLIYKN